MLASVPRPAYPQTTLLPPQARPIGELAGVLEDDKEGGIVFVSGWATFGWKAGDEAGRRLAALQLISLRVASHKEVAAGFATGVATLWRWEQAYRAQGLAGLMRERPGPRGPHKLTPELRQQIQRLDAQGLSLRKIAEGTQLSTDTIRRALNRVPGGADASAPAPPTSDETT